MSDDLEAVFRREAGRCTATLIRILSDIDLAEDAVAEAFSIAAEKWPVTGMPPNPGGWITTTARNRAIDRLRRESTRMDRYLTAHRLSDTALEPENRPEIDELDGFVDVVADDQLRLIFLCCHPALSPDAQVGLTLRLPGGLETTEIARQFLVPEATMAQRIVRAKRKLRDNHAPYRIPSAAELADRLHVVLTVIALIYTEGHTATSGDQLVRTQLSHEAIRLGRVLVPRPANTLTFQRPLTPVAASSSSPNGQVRLRPVSLRPTPLARRNPLPDLRNGALVELMPDEPEAVGLLALLLLTDARRPARVAADGSMVRLMDQDRTLWDRSLIAEGHQLVRACLRRNQPGPFQIQAAIAAVHADAPTGGATDWTQIVALYDQLQVLRPDPIVALNRAVAVGELHGPEAGLAAIAELDTDQLGRYQPFHAVHADLLLRSGRLDDATTAYDRAIELTTNPAERRFLEAQRASTSHSQRQASSEPNSRGVAPPREKDKGP